MKGLVPYTSFPFAHNMLTRLACILRRLHRITQNLLRLKNRQRHAIRHLWHVEISRGIRVNSSGDIQVPGKISHSSPDVDMEQKSKDKSHLNKLERNRYHRLKKDPVYKAKRRLAKIDYTIRQLTKERQWILRDLHEAVTRNVEQPVPSLLPEPVPELMTSATHQQENLQMTSVEQDTSHFNDWELDLDAWESILDSLFPERHGDSSLGHHIDVSVPSNTPDPQNQ